MTLSAILFAAASLTATPVLAASDWSAPAIYLPGTAYSVEVTLEATGEPVPAWWLSAAAFSVDGQALGERGDAVIALPAGANLTLAFDLAPHLGTREAGFRLTCDAAAGDKALDVRVLRPAPAGLDFMTMPVEDLDGYQVLMQTNRGDMLAEFWPDVAPGHVRNYLDLCYTDFYAGILFHRVSPSFMIQGGCPNTKDPSKPQASWGTGGGPRPTLKAEFSDRKHVRGVLSMARSTDPDSASSQFFVMTQDSPFLDGQYSAFGRVVEGLDTLDAIANAKGFANRDGTVRPNEPQRIEKAVVVIKETPAEGEGGE